MGKLNDSYFIEPSDKDWEDYKSNKRNLMSYVYQIWIDKIVSITREELETVGITYRLFQI